MNKEEKFLVNLAKIDCLDNPLITQEWNRLHKAVFFGFADDMSDFKDCFGEFYHKACKSLSSSRFARVKRCRLKIGGIILEGKCSFITLTFSNEAFEKYKTRESRRRLVARFLKKRTPGKYVANIDFGDENGREHYHAIIEGDFKEEDFDWWRKKVGFLRVRKVKNSEKDMKRILKYTVKPLSAHAVKESTSSDKVSFERLIYSRNR